jgi:hypothetical protein
MMTKQNVFISWSGERSKLIAEALREWLPMVVQLVKPWMSSQDIDKGSRGLVEMAQALNSIKVGITCLTPENLTSPWILYEAGCLSKTIDDSTRLCTYLLGGLQNKDIEPPLSQFQHTNANVKDTRALVHTVNKAVGGEDALSEKTLDSIFAQFWPKLEEQLNKFPKATAPVTKRSVEDMIEEILELTRSESRNRENSVKAFRDAAKLDKFELGVDLSRFSPRFADGILRDILDLRSRDAGLTIQEMTNLRKRPSDKKSK